MNEKTISKICIIGLVISLCALYLFTLNVHSVHVNIGDIDGEWTGRTVNVSGMVKNLHSYKGHLFFNLDDGSGDVKVVIWEDTLELLEIRGIDVNRIENGVEINIIGYVEIYEGETEVIPIRDQVSILN